MAAYNNDESQDDPFTATKHLDSSRSSHEIIILQKEDPASSSQQKNHEDDHSQDEYNDNQYSTNSKNNPSHDPGRRDHYGLQQAMKEPDISTSQNNDHDDIAVGIVTNLQECQDQKTHPNNNDNNCQNQGDDDGCNNKMKRRSWSMLELNEMKVIHQLQDDLEEILSGQDVAPNQDLDLHSNSHSDMGHDCVVVDKEEEYLFLDDDDDDDDKEDEYDVEENSSRLSMQGSEKAATWLTTVDSPTRDATTTTSSTTTASTSIQTCTTPHGKKSKTSGKRSLWKKIGFRRSMSVGVLHKHSKLDSEHSVPVVKDRNVSDAEGAQTLSSSSMVPPDISSLDCSHHDVTRHLLVLSLEESFRHSCTLSSPSSVRDLVQEQIVKSPKRNAMKTDKQVVTTAISGIVQSKNDTNPPQASSCPPTHFQLDRERMPQPSILKKSTSMMNLKDTTTRQQHDDDVNPQHSSSPRAKNGNKSLKCVTSFSTLEIREYHVTIGDNPGGKQGPPISLDWDYCKDSTVKIDIDSYEQMRPPRRSKHEMYMPGNIRMWTLMKYLGYSLREIEDASKAADVIRKKRAKSIKYHNIYDLKYRVGKLMKIGNMKK